MQRLYEYMKDKNSLSKLEKLESDINFISQIKNSRAYCEGLFTAIEYNNIDGFKWLFNTINDDDLNFKFCEKDGKSVFQMSIIEYGNTEIFKFLRQNMLDPELKDELERRDNEGNITMHYLFIFFQDLDYIENVLLPVKPDLKIKNDQNISAFMQLIESIRENSEEYESLISKIIDNDKSVLFIFNENNGEIPLFIPVYSSYYDLFDFLLTITDDKESAILWKNNDDDTILHIALKNQVNLKIVESILKISDELDILDELMNTENNNEENIFILYQDLPDGDYKDKIKDFFEIYNQIDIISPNIILEENKAENIQEKIIYLEKFLKKKEPGKLNIERKCENDPFKKSRGFLTNNDGYLYNPLDNDDVELKSFLEENPNNIIFMIPEKDYYISYGTHIINIASDPNTDFYLDCKRDQNGEYVMAPGKKKYYYVDSISMQRTEPELSFDENGFTFMSDRNGNQADTSGIPSRCFSQYIPTSLG